MTCTNDSALLGRRDLLRVGAGAATAAAASASASSATAQPAPADRSSDAVALQDDGNETGGNETGGNETGGDSETPQEGGDVGEEGGDHGGSTGLDDVTSHPLALVGLAGVLAFLSPFALVALLLRNAGREQDQY